MLLRFWHGLALVREISHYARTNRAWWLFLVLPIVVIAVLAVGTVETVVPYTVYTLF